jgi:DNA repair protein RadC
METINKISLKINKSKIKKHNFTPEQITSPDKLANYIRQFFGNDILIFESVFILLLNQNNTTIGYAKISQGGICSSVVDIKIICKYVVDSLAQGVILCHNHPSGNLTPSSADLNVTDKLKEALKYLDSKLIDHIILTENNYYSLADNGKI